MSEDQSKSRVSATVPQSFKEQFRVEAARRDKPMADLVRDALADYVEGDLDLDADLLEGNSAPQTPDA